MYSANYVKIARVCWVEQLPSLFKWDHSSTVHQMGKMTFPKQTSQPVTRWALFWNFFACRHVDSGGFGNRTWECPSCAVPDWQCGRTGVKAPMCHPLNFRNLHHWKFLFWRTEGLTLFNTCSVFMWPLKSIFSCLVNFGDAECGHFSSTWNTLCLGFQNSHWSIKVLTQLTNKLIYSVYSVLFAICPPNLTSWGNKIELTVLNVAVKGQKSCFWDVHLGLCRCDNKLCEQIKVSQHSITRALQLFSGAPNKTICWWNPSLSLQTQGWLVFKVWFQQHIYIEML